MEVVASGAFWDARTAPTNERSASATSAIVLSDGTLLATCRLGTDREGADGHTGIFASTDGGDSWELRALTLGEREWDGWPGETRGWYIAELGPGELIASVLWTDRSDLSHPWVNPVTQGLLRMRVYQVRSSDGGRTWPDRRLVDLGKHAGASSTGPTLRLAGGDLAQPFETWKEYEDPSPGVPAAWLRLSHDHGSSWTDEVVVARHPANAIFYWDQRLDTHPVDGRLVNMFWTHEPGAGRDIDVHIAWGTPDGRSWSDPAGTGLAGQHCQPISLGGDRLLAVYSHRGDPPGIRAVLSEDFGRTFDRAGELVVWASEAGEEPGSGVPRRQEDYWNDMGAWQFGHPRGAVLPSGEVVVVFYGGSGMTRSGRWARVRL
ncbi:MAG: sialidase family protein [Chloroflexota bacterium]